MRIHPFTKQQIAGHGLAYPGTCSVCLTEQDLRLGFTGEYCPACRNIYDPFGGSPGRLAKLRREHLGLTRRELAERTGYGVDTIARYERGNCSEAFFKLVEGLVRAGNNNNSSNQT